MDTNHININTDIFKEHLKKGDSRVYGILFDLYYSRLLHISNSYLNNQQDSEDIVQNVLLKFWDKKKSIDIHGNLNTYLYRMTKNACIDYLRKKKKYTTEPFNLESREHKINLNSLLCDASSKILADELENEIQYAISLLPEKCKKVFIKSRLEGLKHREISEEMNISIKTIETHMSRALKHMRLHLREFIALF